MLDEFYTTAIQKVKSPIVLKIYKTFIGVISAVLRSLAEFKTFNSGLPIPSIFFFKITTVSLKY